MNRSHIIGIDIGTSGCKSILIDDKGNVKGSSMQEYPLKNPKPGWAEQDPEDWVKAVYNALNQLLHDTGVSKIAPICL